MKCASDMASLYVNVTVLQLTARYIMSYYCCITLLRIFSRFLIL